eukprot:6176800-Pleurochrysis_carterae.AAC.2
MGLGMDAAVRVDCSAGAWRVPYLHHRVWDIGGGEDGALERRGPEPALDEAAILTPHVLCAEAGRRRDTRTERAHRG